MSLRVISPDSSSNSPYLQIEYRVLTFNEPPLWNQAAKRDGCTPARKHDALSLQIRQCRFMKTINDNNHDHIDNFRSVFVAYYLHWERVQSSTPSITSLNKKIQTVEPDRYIGSLPYIALQKSPSVGLY